MNTQTKLVFALEHIAHLHDLIEDNEYEHFLNDALCTLEFELERQLRLELDRKNPNNEFTKSIKRENQAVPDDLGFRPSGRNHLPRREGLGRICGTRCDWPSPSP